MFHGSCGCDDTAIAQVKHDSRIRLSPKFVAGLGEGCIPRLVRRYHSVHPEICVRDEWGRILHLVGYRDASQHMRRRVKQHMVLVYQAYPKPSSWAGACVPCPHELGNDVSFHPQEPPSGGLRLRSRGNLLVVKELYTRAR